MNIYFIDYLDFTCSQKKILLYFLIPAFSIAIGVYWYIIIKGKREHWQYQFSWKKFNLPLRFDAFLGVLLIYIILNLFHVNSNCRDRVFIYGTINDSISKKEIQGVRLVLRDKVNLKRDTFYSMNDGKFTHELPLELDSADIAIVDTNDIYFSSNISMDRNSSYLKGNDFRDSIFLIPIINRNSIEIFDNTSGKIIKNAEVEIIDENGILVNPIMNTNEKLIVEFKRAQWYYITVNATGYGETRDSISLYRTSPIKILMKKISF